MKDKYPGRIEKHELKQRIADWPGDEGPGKAEAMMKSILGDLFDLQAGDAILVTTIPMKKQSAEGTGTKCESNS